MSPSFTTSTHFNIISYVHCAQCIYIEISSIIFICSVLERLFLRKIVYTLLLLLLLHTFHFTLLFVSCCCFFFVCLFFGVLSVLDYETQVLYYCVLSLVTTIFSFSSSSLFLLLFHLFRQLVARLVRYFSFLLLLYLSLSSISFDMFYSKFMCATLHSHTNESQNSNSKSTSYLCLSTIYFFQPHEWESLKTVYVCMYRYTDVCVLVLCIAHTHTHTIAECKLAFEIYENKHILMAFISMSMPILENCTAWFRYLLFMLFVHLFVVFSIFFSFGCQNDLKSLENAYI